MSVVRPWICAACGSREVKLHCENDNPGCPWIVCKVCSMITILVRGRPEARSA